MDNLLAAACEILGITKLDLCVLLPPNVKHGHSQACDKNTCMEYNIPGSTGALFTHEEAFTDDKLINIKHAKYNYARLLYHYGALMKFLDSLAEGSREFYKVLTTSLMITISNQVCVLSSAGT